MNAIRISDNGVVAIPSNVKMQEFEVAELFGVKYTTVRRCFRDILKSNVCYGDYAQGGVACNRVIYPEYYGLDIIVAIAFRVNTPNARIIRAHIISKLTQPAAQPIFVRIGGRNNLSN